MKKILSALLLVAMIFMLEFNLLKPILENAYRWVEPVLAFSVLIAVSVWNDLHIKS